MTLINEETSYFLVSLPRLISTNTWISNLLVAFIGKTNKEIVTPQRRRQYFEKLADKNNDIYVYLQLCIFLLFMVGKKMKIFHGYFYLRWKETQQFLFSDNFALPAMIRKLRNFWYLGKFSKKNLLESASKYFALDGSFTRRNIIS